MGRRAKPNKVKAEAKQPLARKSPKNEDSARVRDLEKRLAEALKDKAEALEQQTATSEILRVISSSPTDVQPVFNTIAKSAARLCDAFDAVIYQLDAEALRLVGHAGPIPIGPVGQFKIPLVRGTHNGRVVLERRTMQITDLQAEDGEYPEGSVIARRWGHRTVLGAPLLRAGEAIGVVTVRRTEVRPFTDRQVKLLQTFADQAVIAIENVRLFTELQEKNLALTDAHAQVTESLEQQTATSEILRVISSSPTDVQPVFDIIARNAAILTGASVCNVFRFDGKQLFLVAHHNFSPEAVAFLQQRYPRAPSRDSAGGCAVLDCAVVHLADIEQRPEFAASFRLHDLLRFRGLLAVPLLNEGRPVGAITVARVAPGPFSDRHIALLETFADQAVIAIENVRLFTETKEALEQQTATSDILRLISSSPTDLRPVFQGVAETAARLLRADNAQIFRVEGSVLQVAASHGTLRAFDSDELPPISRGLVTGRAIIDRRTIHVHDLLAEVETEYPEARELQRRAGHRTTLVTPMLRQGVSIGAISILRREVRPFTDNEIRLLETFADQAVIAIENVRLFKELEARNRDLTTALDQQTATSEILRVISKSRTEVQPVFNAIIQSAMTLCAGNNGSLFRIEGGLIHRVALINSRAYVDDSLRPIYPRPLDTTTIIGQALLGRGVVQVPDTDSATAPPVVRDAGRLIGFRAQLSVPMLRNGEPIGGISVTRANPGLFSTDEVQLLQTFADQAVIAIENDRLFKELETANRELAAASQHKSEFLANMSHELRTPLNAIIGFSEVLTDRMFGELNEKQDEYLKDIYASGTHLLSLINDILDLSKIEAGRMELELTDFHLPTALDNALMLVRERAGRRSITLQMSVDERLGEVRADERKIRQVVLNLLSNAIKFTPEGGRIEVGAVPKDGFVAISVSDTGVGIAPEDQEAVFEEFRQVGTADKKAEGTGLGLTFCRKFIELHGGRIWVKSEVGVGSTFTFTIPVRCGK